jgi:A/G-specific adenine glycosylase
MLQQTQVSTGLPFYERWMARFPTVSALAEATEEEVLAMWQGLGYYRRARLLRNGAQFVQEHGWPTCAAEWQRVPSVGPYTAGAIASIAMNEAAPLADGNVERVYARIVGDEASGATLHRNAWKWATKVVDQRRPGDWNQALMELGARVCRPVDPHCKQCPLRDHCLAYQLDRTDQLPTRAARARPIQLTQFVWVPSCEGKFGVRAIAPGKWWEGMYEFPRSDDLAELERQFPDLWPESLGTVRHTVTNHRISLMASIVRLPTMSGDLIWRTAEALRELPMPAPQRRVLRFAERV